VRDSLIEQIIVCDRAIRQLAKKDAVARRLMTVPGVGPVVALAYIAVLDDPQRFAHSRDVGAYLGMTPKRYQSGEVDQAGADLQMWRRFCPDMPLRGGRRVADAGGSLVAAESVGRSTDAASWCDKS
jgi:transposase